jgi:hypothetical protein
MRGRFLMASANSIRFFNIAPREAELMDPQETLSTTMRYEVVEDAGYTRESLSRYQNFWGRATSVYVGVMYEYQLYGAQETMQAGPGASGSHRPSLTGCRIRNFHGPSMAVDTMCSHPSPPSIYLREEGVSWPWRVASTCRCIPSKFIGLGRGQHLSTLAAASLAPVATAMSRRGVGAVAEAACPRHCRWGSPFMA